MAGGGDVPGPRAQAARGGRRKHQTPSLPLDIVLEIAARSDPTTLVRCAATCGDVRRRAVACASGTPTASSRPSCAATWRLLTAADGFPPRPDGKTARRYKPVSSCDGLLLVRTTDWEPPRDDLRVCDPATGGSQTLPPEPKFPGPAQQFWEPIWGKYTEIRAPHLHGRSLLQGGRPLVAGGEVHWLCVTRSGGYVLKLHIRTAQVMVTTLPVSFPCSGRGIDYLLATAKAAGDLMVLVADSKKISAWVQQTKPMAKWKQRPQVVMENEEMPAFRNTRRLGSFHVQLHWFPERSGLILFSSHDGEFWLDLRSTEI
ncbi:hypothetical protein BAE44_0021963, partial [Dichanthelium oligosanthes]